MPSRSPAAAERHCRESLERSLIRRAVAARRRRWRMRGRGLLLVGAVAMSSVGGVALASSGGASTQRTAHVTTLSRGSHGRAVVILQRALGVRPTGTYDAATVRAVRSFQARHGLTVDGVAGPQTLAALGIASKLQGAGHRYRGNVTAEL